MPPLDVPSPRPDTQAAAPVDGVDLRIVIHDAPEDEGGRRWTQMLDLLLNLVRKRAARVG
jgi:hypothetical protein